MDGKQELLKELKQRVSTQSAKVEFIHHEWFVKYHLEIVEAIAIELCERYDKADKFTVLVLAWLHDYEKIINIDNEHNTELVATRAIMKQTGFDEDFISKVCADINTINAKNNLSSASIEVQIVSSSDAASHFVGPFGSLYWYENPSLSMDAIQTERYRKISVDWDKKITLPEIKEVFLGRYNFALEATGKLPENYLS